MLAEGAAARFPTRLLQRRRGGPLLLTVAIALLLAGETRAIQPVVPTRFDGDVRDLAVAEAWDAGDAVLEIERRLTAPPQSAATAPVGPLERDPLLALQEAFVAPGGPRALLPPTVDVEGSGFAGKIPPDTVGDVGPNHYIQMAHGRVGAVFSIYDKAGVLLAGPTLVERLGPPGFPDFCDLGNGDPIVVYDHAADRFVMLEFSSVRILGLFIRHLCVYVSQTSDPVSGGWLRYAFFTPFFPDYPKLAVWTDAYYATTNEPFSAPIYAFERDAMLAGEPARALRVFAPRLRGFLFQALTPGDLDGARAPPPGSPAYFVRHRDDESHDSPANPSRDFLELWQFRPDFSNPDASTLVGPLLIPVADFDSDVCGLSLFFCFPQPGTTQLLDPVREVVMWRLQYRNFQTHETLVGNFTVDVDGSDHGGIRWFELRKIPGGSWKLFQEGTWAPDAAHRWMGSIAMDGQGNIALGYSVSSDEVFPSMRVTGRRADDPLGVMTEPERSLVAGGGSQTGSSRWGDYSAMTVDPVDDCSFWYTNEYLPVTAAFDWRTRITDMRFRSCGNLPPIAALAAEAVIECDAPAGGRVLLNASASTDPDSLPGTNDDIVRFEWLLDLEGENEVALGEGEQLQVMLPLGVSRVTLRVTDSEGHEDSADVEIEVVDTTPPVLSIELRPSLLWPPDHRLVEIAAEVTARDDCDVEVVLESVTSSEPDQGPGHTSDDVQGVELGTLDLAFRVRAERSDGGPGRIYTATYRALDRSGNAARSSAIVAVPRDRSGDLLSFGIDPGVDSLIDENGDVFVLLGSDPVGGVLFSRVAPTAVPAVSAAALAALAMLLAAAGACSTPKHQARAMPSSG